eukprot:TRINITY_DN8159_c0_g1_i17.p3 TRINITY_DN8159_c0_g1~~TRINITY_DN8159_c0_g1_i17.p3  ORF type:complete len:149 (+),score=24.30 TRINITY_DN8159_c0_g1_i17:961-1407(+)
MHVRWPRGWSNNLMHSSTCRRFFAVARGRGVPMLSLAQDRRTLSRVWHTSLKSHPDHSICSAQSEGHTPLLSVELWSAAQAVRFPALLKMFQPATSLGGAESLIDYRYRWDQTVSDKLLRVSVGIENVRDLQDDFAQAFAALLSAASL